MLYRQIFFEVNKNHPQLKPELMNPMDKFWEQFFFVLDTQYISKAHFS